MPTPHWSYRLSQPSKTTATNKVSSADKRTAKTQAVLEYLVRDRKGEATAQSNRSKKIAISRPFTTGGQYTKMETSRSPVKPGLANERILSSKEMRDFSADTKGRVRFRGTENVDCAVPKSAGKQ